MAAEIITIILDGLLMGSIYAVFALGLSLLWGVMGITNSAHGEVFTTGALLVLFLSSYINPLISILAVAPVMFFVGVVIDQAVFRPIRRVIPVEQMAKYSVIVSIAISIFFINLYLATLGADFWKRSVAMTTGTINILGVKYTLDRILVAVIALCVAGLLALFLKTTRTGMAIRAVAQDREKAMLVGVNTERIYMITWGIATLLAGLAGGLIAPIYVTHPLMGTSFLVYGYIITMVGGMGSLLGGVVASYLISIFTFAMGFYVSNVYKEVFALVIVIILLLTKGGGLFEKS